VALRNADRVKETSTTPGTGTYSLAGAVAGFQTFVAGVGTGNFCHYCAEDGTDWEIGIGLVTDATPDTLARTLVLQSSNGDAAVNWAAGTRNLFCVAMTAGQDASSFRHIPIVKRLSANHAISATAATEVTGLEIPNLQPGSYVVQYFLIVQSATATVGLGLGINFSGTAANPVIFLYHPTTGASAATGVADDEANVLTGSLVEGRATKSYSTTAPNMLNTGVAAINVNNMICITAIITVTAAGNLELWHSSETATSTTVMAGSCVIVQPVD